MSRVGGRLARRSLVLGTTHHQGCPRGKAQKYGLLLRAARGELLTRWSWKSWWPMLILRIPIAIRLGLGSGGHGQAESKPEEQSSIQALGLSFSRVKDYLVKVYCTYLPAYPTSPTCYHRLLPTTHLSPFIRSLSRALFSFFFFFFLLYHRLRPPISRHFTTNYSLSGCLSYTSVPPLCPLSHHGNQALAL